MNNLLLRRRALMGMLGGSKEEYALTKKDQPVILAAFYNAGLCASPDYMTIEEAGAVTSQQIDNVDFSDAVEDFSGFRYFTGVTDRKFQNYNFTHIVFPDSYTTVTNFAFAANPNLLTVVINPAFNPSGTHIFRDCNSLKEIVWRSPIPTFKDLLFNVRVESFICKSATPPTLGNNVFDAIDTVYVPDDSISAYQAAEGWSDYTIKGISEYNGSLKDYVL